MPTEGFWCEVNQFVPDNTRSERTPGAFDNTHSQLICLIPSGIVRVWTSNISVSGLERGTLER